ncbi:MAG: hydroxyacid dehydrogenase [Deltaproteobacteria bacterium]|jgi:D-3-phosphoglycerate dehydrogenase|nr:hydroxyacid dehydrogenase [Deltaproteobacteria bacterium]
MAWKVLLSDKIEEICPKIFKERGIEVDRKEGLAPEELLKIIGDYDGQVVRSATKVTRDVLAKGRAGRLKIVGRAGAGLDNIDVQAAEELGVKVVNTPGLNSNAVAELTIALALSLARHIPQGASSLKEGRWEKKTLAGTEIFGKTMGLVGLGHIGKLVTAKALGLGMRVIAHDPFVAPEEIASSGATPVALAEIWREADYISLHLPKTAATQNIVSREVLAQFKPSAFLLNCARGGLVDEEALRAALEAGQIAGAALDVFSSEPPGDSPLLKLPNFIGVPHLGASTLEAQLGVAAKVAEALADFLDSAR